MLNTLVTYKAGTCAAHVMSNPQTNQVFVMVEDKNGLSEWPIKYDDGRIAYDHIPPQYAKKLVVKAFKAADLLKFARKYEGWHSFAKDVKAAALDLQSAGALLVFEAGSQFMAVK